MQNAELKVTIRAAIPLVEKIMASQGKYMTVKDESSAADSAPVSVPVPAPSSEAIPTASPATVSVTPTVPTDASAMPVATTDSAVTVSEPSVPQGAQQEIDEMLKAGFIIKEGNDYVIVITRSKGILLFNGKPFPTDKTNTENVAPAPVATQ